MTNKDSKDFLTLDPFAQELHRYGEFANVINEISRFIYTHNKLQIDTKERMLDALAKVKSFARSTVIFDSKGNLIRIFFDSPNDLKNFIENYAEKK